MKISSFDGCRRRLVGVLAVGAAGLAAWSPGAQAATARVAGSCPVSPTSQAFSQWGDTNEYELAPGGSFAGTTTGWTLTGGAKILSIKVPFDLGGVGDVGALYLPPGSTAQSPYMCVDPADPTYRFLAASTDPGAGLNAQAVYETALGLQVPLTLSQVKAPSGWGPVPALLTGAAPASVLSGGTARMSLRFTSLGLSLVDDVFVDPHMHMG